MRSAKGDGTRLRSVEPARERASSLETSPSRTIIPKPPPSSKPLREKGFHNTWVRQVTARCTAARRASSCAAPPETARTVAWTTST